MINLIHGDCLEEMKKIPDKSIDFILTDLPYGTTCCKWDSIIPFDKIWLHLNRIAKFDAAIALFGKEPFSSSLRMSNIKMFKYDWIWKKDTKSNFPQARNQPLNNIELILIFSKAYARSFPKNDETHISMKYFPQMTEGKIYSLPKESKASSIFKENHSNGIYKHREKDTSKRFPFNLLEFKTDKNKFHPTQKPVALLEYLIKTYTLEGETVLDFTAGSFSAGVACVNTNRNFIGIEKDDLYFSIGEKRVKEAISAKIP